MRKWSGLALAVVIGTAGCATATNVADGRVARIDWTESVIMLDTRETFVVPARHQMNRLETGDRVAVSYVVEDGRRIATRIWTAPRFR